MNERLSYGKAAPAVYKAMLALQDSVYKSGLEKDLLDVVCLRISQINGCAFCIDMHWRDLRAKGFTEQQLYMLSVWREAEGYSGRQRAALEWAESVTRLADQEVPDDVYRVPREQFSEAELANLTLAVIAINGWNRLNVAFRTPVKAYATVGAQS
jgi:AhpD family alkylhydroperoxidase